MVNQRIIKRYQNRKLYDFDSSSYVTLTTIANFVKSGDNIFVIDNKSGQDITNLLLLKVIHALECHKLLKLKHQDLIDKIKSI